MSMAVGARDPVSVAVICMTLLVAYLLVLLPNRRLFALSADARKLMRFMGLKHQEGRIRFFVATFREQTGRDLEGRPFSYASLPRNDVEAMIEIVAVLAKYGVLKEARNPLELLIDEHQALGSQVDSLVYIGGPRVSGYAQELVDRDGLVSFEPTPNSEMLTLRIGGGLDRGYSMRPPSPDFGRTMEDALGDNTYGCVMKRVDPEVVRFSVWGLDARGTVAAAHWLATSWKRLPTDFGIDLEDSFTAVVRVPPRSFYAARPRRADAPEAEPPLLLPD
jgi:hypothetical protein